MRTMASRSVCATAPSNHQISCPLSLPLFVAAKSTKILASKVQARLIEINASVRSIKLQRRWPREYSADATALWNGTSINSEPADRHLEPAFSPTRCLPYSSPPSFLVCFGAHFVSYILKLAKNQKSANIPAKRTVISPRTMALRCH